MVSSSKSNSYTSPLQKTRRKLFVPLPEVLVTPKSGNSTSLGSKRKGRSGCSKFNSPVEEGLNNMVNQWMRMVARRVNELTSKVESKRARNNRTSEFASVSACMDILNTDFSYLSHAEYIKVANSFKNDVDWRECWMSIPKERRPWIVHNTITMTPKPLPRTPSTPPFAGPEIEDLSNP